MKTEFVFIRHGVARKRNPVPEGDTMAFVHDEMSRELTSEGRSNIPYLGEFDQVISSPAARAIQTAMIASGRNPDAIVVPLSTHLWPAEAGDDDWKLVERVFVYARSTTDKKSLVSLRDAYAQASLKEIRACARVSCEAAAGITRLIGGCKRVLVAGHMLHLQAAARVMGAPEKIADLVLEKGAHFSFRL